jgi:hypothetical protein
MVIQPPRREQQPLPCKRIEASASWVHLQFVSIMAEVIEMSWSVNLHRAAVLRVATATMFAAKQITIGDTMCQYRSCLYVEVRDGSNYRAILIHVVIMEPLKTITITYGHKAARKILVRVLVFLRWAVLPQ